MDENAQDIADGSGAGPRERSQSAATVSDRIADELAAAADCQPLELPPLFDAVDADALDRLVATDGAETLHVQFRHAGYTVEVFGDGTVDVTPSET